MKTKNPFASLCPFNIFDLVIKSKHFVNFSESKRNKFAQKWNRMEWPSTH